MYQVNARIRGLSPILQHAFTGATLEGLTQNANKRTAKADYSLEWMQTMYVNQDGWLYQPASHIEGALVKAATRFQMKGKQTFKEPVKANVYAQPDEILHLRNGECVPAPDESLLFDPTSTLRVNIMRVVVQRSAVARARLEIAPGWELAFRLEVTEDLISPPSLREFLEEAGRAVGIGDYRPRFGRFEVVDFQPV